MAPRMARYRSAAAFFPALRVALLAAAFLGAGACGSDPCTGRDCPGAATTGSGGTGGAATGGTGGGAGAGMARAGACTSDASCDTAHGFSCTVGECRYACRTHFDCEGQGICQPLLNDSGESVGDYCALLPTPEPAGQYYTRCPNYDECDTDAGFYCLGSGVGDADAYCSGPCAADPDCPSGFFCDQIADENGDPHSLCTRRRFCAPCETDADCLTVDGQVCAHGPSGEKTCTTLCDPGVDSCPWGNAAVCGVFDADLGVPTCAHRFGSCHGEGKGCEPCVRDGDCPNGFCFGSGYTGERWCIDNSVKCNCDGLETTQHVCAGGNGCPRTPGDLKMSCYDFQRSDTDPIAHACFEANTTGSSDLASPQAGCWGPL
jgi:hypothetical protein